MKIFPIVKKIVAGGGGAGTPTIGYEEAPAGRDSPVVAPVQNDRVSATDRSAVAVVQVDHVEPSELWNLTFDATYRELPRGYDRGRQSVVGLGFGRSGSPDSDLSGDAWTDAATLPSDQRAVNHGNEALQVVNLASGAKRGWMQWNFGTVFGSSLSWDTDEAGTNTLRFRASAALIITNPTLTFRFDPRPTKPFVESTIAHTGAPTTTPAVTKTVVVTGTAVADYSITFTPAEMSTIIWDEPWVMCEITSGDLTNTVTILSRDAAAASDRPQWDVMLREAA